MKFHNVAFALFGFLAAQIACAQTPPAITPPATGSEKITCLQGGVQKTCTSAQIAQAVRVAWNITDVTAYGADPTGAADSTTAVNNALASGGLAIFFPPGAYKVCGVTVPHTFNLHIFGAGTASKLIQTACGSPIFKWSTAAMDYSEQTISDLTLDGTLGTGHVIDTSGEGGITLRDLYFKNTPAGFDNIFFNGAAATVMHDDRAINIQIYDQAATPAGNALIEFGALSADSVVDNAIGNGNGLVGTGLKVASGATTLTISNTHLYNATGYSLDVEGCQNCQFHGNTWDFGAAGVALIKSTHSTFTGEQFEATQVGTDAITLTNASDNIFSGTIWTGSSSPARYIVRETGTSDYNIFIAGSLSSAAAWNASPVSLIGAHSYVNQVPGYNLLGAHYALAGVGTVAQAQATTLYYGTNVGQTSSATANYMIPITGVATSAYILVDTTPAAGQTFTFTVYDGASAIGTMTVNNGQYGGTISLNAPVAFGDLVYIKSVFSATSGSAIVRYNVNFFG